MRYRRLQVIRRSFFGQYMYIHVSTLTFKPSSLKEALMCHNELCVKGRRCLLADPEDRIVLLRIHKLQPHVPDSDLNAALSNYCAVAKVIPEESPDPYLGKVQTMIPQVYLKANDGITFPRYTTHDLRLWASGTCSVSGSASDVPEL